MVTNDEVRLYLRNVDFPATRDDIIEEAAQSDAPEPVLKALRAMPPLDYRNREEVLRSARTQIAGDTSAEKAVKARDRRHQRVAEYLRDPDPG